MHILISFIVGFAFALGLGISGMTQPEIIINFLDFAGNWDPRLLFVLLSAVGVHMLTYHWIMKRSSPILDSQFHVPTRRDITPRLVSGAAIFGIGWGISGFCPGPALTSLTSGYWQPILYVGAMLIGMALYQLVDRKILNKTA